MTNGTPPAPPKNRSFLLPWALANLVGLPALLGPHSLGYLLTVGLAVLADGASLGVVAYIVVVVIMALSGAVLGGWFGLMQWLVLRRQGVQARKWIFASSIGVALGAPLGWLVYGLVFRTMISRPEGLYFSFSYEYISFGMSLGLSIGIAQWLVMRRWVHKAEWWILALPLCFTLAMLFANLYLISERFMMTIYGLAQRLAILIPEIENMQVLFFFAAFSAIVALLGVALVTGVLMDWLLRSQKKPEVLGGF